MIKKHRNNAFQIQVRPLPTEKVETPAETNEIAVKKPKIGFKGFDKNLTCSYNGRKQEYQIGEVYSKPAKPNPKLCTSDGFHYCNSLKDVFTHYANNNGNRFCRIEVLGDFTDDESKSITTSLKVLEEIDLKEIEETIAKVKEENLAERLGLPTIQKIQKAFPFVQVTGSTGLFLHGIRLKRWETSGSGDLDLVVPFYYQFEDTTLSFDEGTDEDQRSEECDFQQVVYIDERKIDVRIDNKQRYEMIEYEGFKYRVSILEHIMEAKFRYALQGNQKHKSDVYEICGKKVAPKPVSDIDDDDILF